MDIKQLENIPHKPGVYLWKDEHKNVIYVGKAKNLNNRMKQYFRGMLNSFKTSKLVEKISSYEYIITNNEKEALVLERNLIEKYAPEFNILLLDDKRYPYIKIALKEELEISMVYRVRSQRDSSAFYYGPFPQGFGAKKIFNILTRLTKYHQGLPISNVPHQVWEEKFEYAKKILSVSTNDFIKELKQKMFEASEEMLYEVARDLKETIDALEAFKSKQVVEFTDQEVFDVIAFVQNQHYLSVSMFFYRQGLLLSSKQMVLEIVTSKEDTISQFISQYYHYNFCPKTIISNEEFLSEIPLVIPQKGKYKQVLDMAITNANDNIELKLASFVRKEELTIGAFNELKHLLNLENLNHIVMVDNSNTNNTLPVSAFVSYRNGIKQKHEYRKYSLEVNDSRKADVEYMKQGLTKYFSKPENPIPDLLIVDGGKSQINEAKKIVPQLSIVGLVKDENHQTEFLVGSDGFEIPNISQNLFNFLSGMQIEVDRYAKFYHAKKRTTTLEGELSTIKGIGPKVETKLLNHFKTYSNIYNASLDELTAIVSKEIAQRIVSKFKEGGWN